MNVDGKTLKRLHRCVGWDQHDLSDNTGIPCWRIAFAETGRTTLTTDECKRIVAAILKQAQRNVAWLQEQFK